MKNIPEDEVYVILIGCAAFGQRLKRRGLLDDVMEVSVDNGDRRGLHNGSENADPVRTSTRLAENILRIQLLISERSVTGR